MQTTSKTKRVVCLIGMDGSGKTTHAHRIIAHLQKSGDKCRYVWFGNAYFFSNPFMIFCRILGFTATHHLANGALASEHQYYKNKIVSFIWPWIQFVDVAIFMNLRVRLPLWRGFTVVCDRCVPDILVELIIDLNDDKLYGKLIGKLILKLMPQPSLTILLNVNEKTAWQRKNDVPELKYLIRRRNEYQRISRYLKIPIVDADGPIILVQQRLISIVDGWKTSA